MTGIATAQSFYNVGTSQDMSRTFVHEIGSTAGGVGGGDLAVQDTSVLASGCLGAEAGTPGGPYGIGAGIIGGYVGGNLGGKAADFLYDSGSYQKRPYPYGPSRPEPGREYDPRRNYD